MDYLDKTRSPRERAEDLLSRMTLEEKIHQLSCHLVPGLAPEAEKMVSIENGIGELAVMSGQFTPEAEARMVNALQEKVIASSRFGIPALLHCEALTGLTAPCAAQFPMSIAIGASFEPSLLRRIADEIRQQMVAVGIRQALSPNFDIARDLRWGRVNETYGSDPTLVTEMACAFVDGLQGEDPREGVAATAKHFLGYSCTEGGVNMARTASGGRELREVFAKPFEAAIRGHKLLAVMNSYSEYDGRPICADRRVLTELLREELGFEGLVVSDYMSVDRLVKNFRVAEDVGDAAVQCLRAGLDVELPEPAGYNAGLIEKVKQGVLDEAVIDRSCLRVLELKFRLGLFEKPFAAEGEMLSQVFHNPRQYALAHEAARKAMTLTKNSGILPLTDRSCKIAVIGPTGNNLRRMFSTYTAAGFLEIMLFAQNSMAGTTDAASGRFENRIAEEKTAEIEGLLSQLYPQAKTIYAALAEKYPHISYVEGCDYIDPEKTDFEAAVRAASEADVVILTVGGKNGTGATCTNGENVDSASLDLPGAQEELLQRVIAANANTVVVHTDAKPLVSIYAYEHAAAILEGWFCCADAGTAIAETICGENVPSGRLPHDVPYGSGVMSYHYQNNASHVYTLQNLGTVGYADRRRCTLRPFGYGLSYTRFAYSDLRLEAEENGAAPTLTVSVTVENTGSVAGDEVVQLYGKDLVASCVRPYHELLGFKRVTLGPGEKKSVRFTFNLDALSFIDEAGEWICEAGDFRFFTAANSDDESLSVDYRLNKTVKIDPSTRCFWATAEE